MQAPAVCLRQQLRDSHLQGSIHNTGPEAVHLDQPDAPAKTHGNGRHAAFQPLESATREGCVLLPNACT